MPNIIHYAIPGSIPTASIRDLARRPGCVQGEPERLYGYPEGVLAKDAIAFRTLADTTAFI